MNGCNGDGCRQGRWPQMCNCHVGRSYPTPQPQRELRMVGRWLLAYVMVMSCGAWLLVTWLGQ